MNQTEGKQELKVLLRRGTRRRLSILYDNVYKDQYPSFSFFIEDVIVKGLRVMK